jgi:enoyl-CoA hydratase/carnithine racemase
LALELVLTGEPMAAERARELGLVNRVCEPGQATEAALALAAQIAQNAPLAVWAAKQIAYASVELPVADAFAWQQPLVKSIRDSDDAREGIAAFAEKRQPVWQGR